MRRNDDESHDDAVIPPEHCLRASRHTSKYFFATASSCAPASAATRKLSRCSPIKSDRSMYI